MKLGVQAAEIPMSIDPIESEDVSVPQIAVVTAQIVVGSISLIHLVILLMALFVIVIDKRPPPDQVTILTIGCVLGAAACFALRRKLDSVSRFLAWGCAPLETRQLTRFKRGSHYLCGIVLQFSCYFFPAAVCWLMLCRERNLISFLLGLVLTILMLVEFPTKARAIAWSSRYFRRPSALTNA